MVSRVDLHHFLITIVSTQGENRAFFQLRNEAISIDIGPGGLFDSFIFEFSGLNLTRLDSLAKLLKGQRISALKHSSFG